VLKRLIISITICWTIFAQKTPTIHSPDPWQSLRFLIGTWQARTQGGTADATATGTYTFRLELRDHVLARHTASTGCKGPTDFDCDHGDILYVYPDLSGQGLKAIYFDNEGHVIHYAVTSSLPDSVVFLSDPSLPGPQFRLTYELRERVLYGKFQLRVPGQNDFKSYLEWSGPKK
jgi:hypothetical protein